MWELSYLDTRKHILHNTYTLQVLIPIINVSNANLIRGVYYALLGYYPELKTDFRRSCSAGAGVGLMLGGVIYDEPLVIILGVGLYGVSRFLPRLDGYKERWRFRE